MIVGKFVLLLLFSANVAFAQDKAVADSLANDLKKQRTDTGKLKTLSELVFFYATNTPKLSLQFAKEQKKIADKIKIPTFSANALNDLAIANYYLGNYNEALLFNKAALKIREGIGKKALLISSLNKIALIYQETGNYDTAAFYQFKILKLAEELKDESFIGITNNNIAFIFYNLKNYEKSAFYAKIALAIAIKTANKNEMARSYGNIASNFDDKNVFDSADFYYKKSIELFKYDNDLNGQAGIYNNLGVLYRKNKRNTEGLNAYRQAYNIAQEMGNENDKAYYAANIGQTLLDLNQYPEAFKNLKYSLNVALKLNNKEILKTAYNGLSVYYFINKATDSGFFYQALYNSVVDTLYSYNNTKQIGELQTKYETEKKEQQLLIQKSEIKQKNYLIWSIIGICFLLVFSAFNFYRKKQSQNKLELQKEVIKQQDLATKAILEAEEKERERIARDLHDGVGQVMSAAKMNLSAFENELIFKDEQQKLSFEKVIHLIDEGCKEVRSVSHQMMPNALLKAGLASAIKEFIDKIDTRVLKVNLYSEGLNDRIDNNIEIVLYRIIQECVNNVIKHSGANQLDISLIKDKDGISVSIEDNGKGFDAKDKTKFEGIGLKNIASRIEFLKGTVEFDSSNGRGTMVAINVPAV